MSVQDQINWLGGYGKRGGLKLNIGSGFVKAKGWVSIDKFCPDAQYQEDIMDLKFKDEADEIFCSHVLEHLSKYQVPMYIQKFKEMLKIGGRMTLIVPDLEYCINLFMTTKEEFRWGWPHDIIFGGQTREGDIHRTGFTWTRLLHYLEQVGGFNIELTREAWIADQKSLFLVARRSV